MGSSPFWRIAAIRRPALGYRVARRRGARRSRRSVPLVVPQPWRVIVGHPMAPQRQPPSPASDPPDPALSALNASGFLFQMRVEEEVKAGRERHDWAVAAREHPWHHEKSGHSGFADLVLADGGGGRLVVECKRSKRAHWYLIVPADAQSTVRRAPLYWTQDVLVQGVAKGQRLGWGSVQVFPETFESAFCIVRGSGENDQPLLERIGTPTVRARHRDQCDAARSPLRPPECEPDDGRNRGRQAHRSAVRPLSEGHVAPVSVALARGHAARDRGVPPAHLVRCERRVLDDVSGGLPTDADCGGVPLAVRQPV